LRVRDIVSQINRHRFLGRNAPAGLDFGQGEPGNLGRPRQQLVQHHRLGGQLVANLGMGPEAAAHGTQARPFVVPIGRQDQLGGRADPLRSGGLRPLPSHANFVLCELGVDDIALHDRLLRRGVLVRTGRGLGLPGWARITVGPDPLMDRAAAALLAARAELLAEAA